MPPGRGVKDRGGPRGAEGAPAASNAQRRPRKRGAALSNAKIRATSHEDDVLGERARSKSRSARKPRWEAATGACSTASSLPRGALPGRGLRPGGDDAADGAARRAGRATSAASTSTPKLGREALGMHHDAGNKKNAFVPADLEAGAPIPGAPFDLVSTRGCCCSTSATRPPCYAACGTRSLPAACLVVHDYDCARPTSAGAARRWRSGSASFTAAFTGAGRDIHNGHRLPLLFAAAGLGAPDGTESPAGWSR